MSTHTLVVDRITRVAPLGMRFWDDVSARVVADGLAVTVSPKGEPDRRAMACANHVGTFVLPHLPGARAAAIDPDAADAAFRQPRTYVIEVIDGHGRFQPFTIEQPLPARGLATPPCLPLSPPIDAVPIFSTPARHVPEGMAVVRADLSARVPGASEAAPASWAVLEVQVAGEPPARGIADREGRVAVIFPYPEPVSAQARAASPPFVPGESLWEQEWPLRLAVFYDAVAPAPAVPDLCRTLAQRAARLWMDAGATRPLPPQTLRYGQELIVRNPFVTTAGSPP